MSVSSYQTLNFNFPEFPRFTEEGREFLKELDAEIPEEVYALADRVKEFKKVEAEWGQCEPLGVVVAELILIALTIFISLGAGLWGLLPWAVLLTLNAVCWRKVDNDAKEGFFLFGSFFLFYESLRHQSELQKWRKELPDACSSVATFWQHNADALLQKVEEAQEGPIALSSDEAGESLEATEAQLKENLKKVEAARHRQNVRQEVIRQIEIGRQLAASGGGGVEVQVLPCYF